ncbi:MAG: copper homeostasis protein CutC [Bacteroidales bacterium]|nr:copper homeostasis protein CutC [Bacteroidales bacterium]
MTKGLLFECCCTSVQEVAEAIEGGAGRIELCEELGIGGVTPSEDLIREVQAVCTKMGVPVNVLVRPRGGDFVYSEEEAETMLQQISLCKALEVNGVVIGALTPDGDVVMPLMKRLIAEAAPLEVTFHRAFDECRNPRKALEDIISLGCQRLLSSGQAKSAYEGRGLLAELVRQAAGRIIVMPGAGINPINIASIVEISGAVEFHGSAHGPVGKTDRETVSAIIQHLAA